MVTKPKSAKVPTLLTLRVNAELVRRLDAATKNLERPGEKLSRADVVRMLLLEALPAHERAT